MRVEEGDVEPDWETEWVINIPTQVSGVYCFLSTAPIREQRGRLTVLLQVLQEYLADDTNWTDLEGKNEQCTHTAR